MRYLEINLDPFLALSQLIDAPLCNPLNLLGFIEAAGVCGISYTNRPEYEGLINIAAMRTMSKCRLNIRANIESQAIQRAMSARPEFYYVGESGRTRFYGQSPFRAGTQFRGNRAKVRKILI